MSDTDIMQICNLFPAMTMFVSRTVHSPIHSTSPTFHLESRQERSTRGLGTDSLLPVTLPRRQLRDSSGVTPLIILMLFFINCFIPSGYRFPSDNRDSWIVSTETGSNGGIFLFGSAVGDVIPVSVPRTSLCSNRSLSSISIHPITDGSTTRLLTFGLVSDSHYDTFPVGEKAPWQSLSDWYMTQRKQISGSDIRRHDLTKDKMEEAIEVFNKLYDGDQMTSNRKGGHAESETGWGIDDRQSGGRRMDLVVNIGDLINNNGMRNLKPVMDIFNGVKAPHYHVLGNHDLRAHNDRFGKVNKYQHAWIRHHMLNNGMSNDNSRTKKTTDRDNSTMIEENHRWFFSIRYPPFFRLIFVDSMVMEPGVREKQKVDAHMSWLKRELQAARETKHEVVILFSHIPIGLTTNIMGPTLKKYDDIILAFFHGHDHEGGYTKQGNIHSIIIQGQVEGLVNAYAVVEVFPDRLEVTGFGRVTTRVLPFESKEALARLHHSTDEVQRAVKGMIQHPPMNSNGQPTISGPWWESAPAGDAGSMPKCYNRPDLRYIYAEPLFPSVSSNVTSNPRLLFRPLPSHLMWKDHNGKESEGKLDSEDNIGGNSSDRNTKLKKDPPQTFPPLLLNIPNYRKPLIPYVEPNPGNTLLLREVYSKWPKRVRKVTASEAPVQLNDGSPRRERPVWLISDKVESESRVHNGIFAPMQTISERGLNVSYETKNYDLIMMSFLLVVLIVVLLIKPKYHRLFLKVRR